MWGIFGIALYMNMNRFAFDGRGAVTNVYQYLEYLPVSHYELNIYRLKKLISLQTKVYLIAQVGQVLFGLVASGRLAWANLLLPLVCAFLLPLLVVGTYILVSK
jgi:hypothetical protein